MHFLKTYRGALGALACAAVLSACGGGGSGDDDSAMPETGKETGVCGQLAGDINQSALETADCQYLSSYRLFGDETNPTTAPNGTGIPYDLTTPLFTDYSSKYRFVFVPEGKQAQYSEKEAFDFPVGTVISKTFSMPADTAFRGFKNERLIETRLMIRRADGWATLPYIWNDDFSDATLQIAGGAVPVTTVHNGNQMEINYRVPDKTQCKQCHQVKVASESASEISPIGPKARLLNRNFNYPSGEENQLSHWEAAGILDGAPADKFGIDTIPAYTDADASLLSGKSDTELMALAKGYLDINCSHCHRPEGGASNTGLHLEYWREFAANLSHHGVCKKPVAYGGGSLSYDVVPGDAENSIIHFRMNTTKPGDKMPEIGRTSVHEEGVELISEWINRGMPSAPACTP
ncbi:SO2930 family diheme c-type cytochrome [Marinobacter sp. BGYM27]|uniref:SO2930 family diheme c-type cytochrome n=1 Tax=unclassified Marinobacter TaxID=83889 RepID=UPI0021A4E4C1|nr:SO2930 family diheme c-type cytochrome [Marinobacter sp. BGYM27]MDG5498384.1 SO2930 family diheme c-type cytochrome [Marinobacter sp. BGYM27]